MLRQTLHKYSDELYILSQTFTNSLSQLHHNILSDGLFITSFQLYSNMGITLHIFIELFLRNDLIKFIQTLQTFQQTWYRSSTHLHHNTLFLRIELANTSLNVDLHRNIYFNIHFILHLTIYETILHHNNWVTGISSIIHHILSQLFPNTSSQQLSDRLFNNSHHIM